MYTVGDGVNQIYKKLLRETFQAQIEEILRNIEPALENVFLEKKRVRIENQNKQFLVKLGFLLTKFR